MTASSADMPVVSLRKSRPQRKALPIVLSARLDLAFAAAGNRIGPLHLVAAGTAAASTIGLVCTAASLQPALAIALGGAAAAGVPALLLRFAQSRYQRKFLEIFPEALDLIVRAVRSGLPAPEAIELATHEVRPPVGTEFQQILDELRIGTEMEEALHRAADRIRVPDFRFFAVSLLLQRQTGGGIAETLSNLSGIIRQRKALRMKARALTAEAQASAAIVGTTPFVAGVGLFLINRDLVSVLYIDPRGRFLLGIAVASLLSGIGAMRALIKRNLR
jgi:Flp pilus assembly protein TadB